MPVPEPAIVYIIYYKYIIYLNAYMFFCTHASRLLNMLIQMAHRLCIALIVQCLKSLRVDHNVNLNVHLCIVH